MAHRVSVRNQKDEITGSSRALQNGFRAEKTAQRKNWERQLFYLLTPALMGDACTLARKNWERQLFYLLTPALMGDTCTCTCMPIHVVHENVLAPVTTIHHPPSLKTPGYGGAGVVNGAGVLDAQLAWHSFEEKAFHNSKSSLKKSQAMV